MELRKAHTDMSNCWSEKNLDEFLPKIRRILDKKDEQEIKDCLVKYTETIELIHARYPNMGHVRADWALAMALSPDWYGEALSTRLQNAMLVSALLLTVTASIFIAPPLSDNTSTSFRVLIYVTGACNMFFILSIMTGIFFIENAMSRAYGESERFTLIIKFYTYKDISQIFMAIGSALFPIILAIPMWDLYLDIDANILIIFTVIYVLATIYIMIRTSMEASKEQARRLSLFSILLEPETSRLQLCYYPPDATMKPDDFKAMYQL